MCTSPARSPTYVRKPMPINERPPVLPKSKQLNMETESKPGSSRSGPAVSPNKENATPVNSVVKEPSVEVLKQAEDFFSSPIKAAKSVKKISPLSPKLNMHKRKRPSTLLLERKEKRSSLLSATPSSDSSKSSKTFDYDDETKERILSNAIREEESFLEYIKGSFNYQLINM